MAEIPIERKARRSVSPLLLILLLIVLIGAGWYWWTNKNAAAGTTTSSINSFTQVATLSVPTRLSSHLRSI